MTTIESIRCFTLFLVMVSLDFNIAYCDDYGTTKETRTKQQQQQFESGDPCAARFDNNRTNLESFGGYVFGAAIGFVPVIGGPTALAFGLYEAGRAGVRGYIELTAWRCFYTECIPSL